MINKSSYVNICCFLVTDLDEPCTSDQECITQNSKCGEVCRCKINYIQSQNKDACLRGLNNLQFQLIFLNKIKIKKGIALPTNNKVISRKIVDTINIYYINRFTLQCKIFTYLSF